MREQYRELSAAVHIAPVVATDNTALTGTAVDLANTPNCIFVVQTGTLADADATFAVELQESSDNSNWAAAASTDYVGDTSFTFANDGATKKVSYIGRKRYARIVITPTGNTGNAPIAAVSIVSGVRVQPV